MEFSFNINELVNDTITVVDDKLAPFRSRVKNDRHEFANKQAQLKTLIDKMGEASTRAQGLRAPITSAMKLQHSDHRLYIMKDASANNGLGAAVGILKVGHKKLFLLDMQSIQMEVQPLCVLDFYIHESRQRTGCGKRMFEHMLKMENKAAHQLAIDRPSHKFVAFQKKYYGLKNAIPQANNFVIHEHFFSDLPAVGFVPRRSQRLADGGQSGRPPVHPYRRTSHSDNEAALSHRRNSGAGRPSYRPNSGRSLSRLSNQSGDANREANGSATFTMNDSLRDINLPPIGPRPSSRTSAPGSRESSAGRRSATNRLGLGSSDKIQPEAYNASRGLAARATSYSRHSGRCGSADIVRSIKVTEPVDTSPDVGNFSRNNSGGRLRSLHLTSTDNPFGGQGGARELPTEHKEAQIVSLPAVPQTTAQETTNTAPQQDCNSNITTTTTEEETNSASSSSSRNFSVNALFNSRFGVRPPFLGSSWNVFGIPSYMNKDSSSPHYLNTKRNQQRHHPF